MCQVWALFSSLPAMISVQVLQQPLCNGIATWRSHERTNLGSVADTGELWSVTYIKQRNDTTLRSTLSTTSGMVSLIGCSEWFLRFDGHECSDPAPIVTLVNNQIYISYFVIIVRPMVLSGFCRATSQGPLYPGEHTISLHVRPCVFTDPNRSPPGGYGFDAHTGRPTNWGPGGNVTSTFCLRGVL